jgi:hypothetical protein
MNTHEKRNKVWLEGYHAYFAGVKMNKNPYRDETDKSETWYEGYTWAIEEETLGYLS